MFLCQFNGNNVITMLLFDPVRNNVVTMLYAPDGASGYSLDLTLVVPFWVMLDIENSLRPNLVLLCVESMMVRTSSPYESTRTCAPASTNPQAHRQPSSSMSTNVGSPASSRSLSQAQSPVASEHLRACQSARGRCDGNLVTML